MVRLTDRPDMLISGRKNKSMWPDRVLNPRPLDHESDALPTALRGPAQRVSACMCVCVCYL